MDPRPGAYKGKGKKPLGTNTGRMDSELLALQWMEHSRIFSQAIGSLRGKAAYTDATLACEGRFFPVHKFVLSTCSEYFNAIFEWTPCVNPVVVLNNVACKELEALLDFMYIGEVNVRETQIPDVMHAAECLRIRGLAMIDDDGVKTQLSARSPADLDGPVKKKRRPNVQRSVATSSHVQLPPPTHPAPHLNSHTPRLPPPTVVATTSAHQLSPEPKFSSAVDHHDNSDHPHHSQLLKPHHHQTQQQTSPIHSSTTVNLLPPQPPHTPQPSLTSQHCQLGVNPNHQTETSASHLSAPQHASPTDHSTRGQSQEISIPPVLTPIHKVIQEVKMRFDTNKQQAPETQPEDGSVGIPDLLDSLVDMRPLYDAKGTQGEEIATFHSAEASENLYDFTEEFPETSSSSQSDAQYQRTHTTSSSQVKVEKDSTGETTRFKCQYCDRSYLKKESLTRHMRIHTKEPYTCAYCGHMSKTYKSHLEHKREQHSRFPQPKKESSVHKCLLCNFTSNRQDNVKRHMLSHTGEKPHKCPHCDFRAKRSQYLHKHIKNIHKKK